MKRVQVLCFLVSSILFLSHAVAGSNSEPKKLSKKEKKEQASREDGRRLIQGYECLSCHVIDGKGSTGGPNLDNLKRSNEFVVEQLLDPEKHVAKNAAAFNFEPSLMPGGLLSRAEAMSIAAYLLRNQSKRKVEKTPSIKAKLK